MSRISVDQLTKKFDDLVALDNLCFECEAGEFIVVLGKPGAGKTTLLKIIAGIEAPEEGNILFDDKVMNHLAPEKRNVAMAFETYALYPHLSVKKNLLSPLSSPNNYIDKSIREARIREVTKLLEIEPLINRKPSQLSGGQRQRVSLGRALVKAEDSNCVLLDEPISHLDARLRNSLRAELKNYLKSKNATVVYTTADYAEALGIADRILVLIDGKIRMFSSPDELYAHPNDIGVAEMIGDPKINFLIVDETRRISLNEYSLKPPFTLDNGIKYLGIRPHDIEVSPLPKSDYIKATVYITEPIGYDQILKVSIGSKMINIKLPLDVYDFSIDQDIWIRFDWNKMLVFDKSGLLKGKK